MRKHHSVLVTGAAGFIGANLVHRLVAEGHDVHALIGPGTAEWRLDSVRRHVTLWRASLEDREAVFKAVRGSRPRWVLHVAAHGAYSSQKSVQRMVGANVVGTMHLVEAALACDVQSLVHTGSSSEYGYKDHAPREDEWADPNSHYAVTKAAATMFCRYTSLSSERPLTTLRLYSVYGPWEEPTRLMPSLVVLGLRGELPPLVAPEIARDYVHVDDVVDACLQVAARSTRLGAVYNIGTGRQTSLRQLVEVARSSLDIAVEPDWGSMAARDWDTDIWVADGTSIAQDLDWRPTLDLEAGFRRFVDWFREDDRRIQLYLTQRDLPS